MIADFVPGFGGGYRQLAGQVTVGAARRNTDGIVVSLWNDFTQDLNKISVHVLVLHRKDGQIVPIPCFLGR